MQEGVRGQTYVAGTESLGLLHCSSVHATLISIALHLELLLIAGCPTAAGVCATNNPG